MLEDTDPVMNIEKFYAPESEKIRENKTSYQMLTKGKLLF